MTGFDISTTTAPRSDQQNFDDYLAGPRTVTISEVKRGSDEQPVEVHLVEFPGRPFKPAKSMRRVLVAAWGPDASEYAGRRMELVGDPTVKFGGSVVGGVRIARLSHIDKPLNLSLTVTKGKRAPYVVQPLKEAPPAPTTAGVTEQQLRELTASLRAANLTERTAALAYVRSVIDRDVASSKELTEAEAAEVLEDLAFVISESVEPDADTLPQMETGDV